MCKTPPFFLFEKTTTNKPLKKTDETPSSDQFQHSVAVATKQTHFEREMSHSKKCVRL
jgi:hypothetical protein